MIHLYINQSDTTLSIIHAVNCSIFLIVVNGAFIKGFVCYKSEWFI